MPNGEIPYPFNTSVKNGDIEIICMQYEAKSMAARRSSAVCVSCQARQLLLSRRRPTPPIVLTKRQLQTATSIEAPSTDDILNLRLPQPNDGENDSKQKQPTRQDVPRHEEKEKSVGQAKQSTGQHTVSVADSGTDLSFEALWKQRGPRIDTLRKLSNPWPKPPSGKQDGLHKGPPVLPEAAAAVIPHDIFRQMVQEAVGPKAVRQALRVQLLRCERPIEIFRVVAVAMRHRSTAESLAVLEEPIIRALYRCRQHVSDPEVLRTLNAIISRFRVARLRVHPMLTYMGLKFAARARSLASMKRHLKVVHDEGLVMSSNMFRSVIAKCSIGHRGLGEIRNGRWRRRDLIQVLTGFDDTKHLTPEQQYHLGTTLIREDWQYLHGWVAVLARCRDAQGVWNEWEMWKATPARTRPRNLHVPVGSCRMTTRHRGDHWFVEQATMSGDLAIAWKIFHETGLPFQHLKPRTKDRMLDGLEHATIIDDHIRDELVKKFDRDLLKIEEALGVQWVKTEEGGRHELYMVQEEALERLALMNDRKRDEYGFPYDDDDNNDDEPIVTATERELHDAVEGGAA